MSMPVPRQLLTIDPEIEARFAESMLSVGLDFQCDHDLLEGALIPVLNQRYRGCRDLDVLEVGPHATTIVASTMQHRVRQYLGIDYSPSCVAKLNQLFAHQGIRRATARVGNTYGLDLPDGSQDLVVACCHDPLFSGGRAKLAQAFGEIYRVLRHDGELVLGPWLEANYEGPAPSQTCAMFAPIASSSAPFQYFRAVEMAFYPDGCIPPSFVVVLRKNEMYDFGMVPSLVQYDHYEETEQAGRRLVDEWLDVNKVAASERIKEAVQVWKQNRLMRTLDLSVTRDFAVSWSSQYRSCPW